MTPFTIKVIDDSGEPVKLVSYECMLKNGFTPLITGMPNPGEVHPPSHTKQTHYHWSSLIHFIGGIPVALIATSYAIHQGIHFLIALVGCVVVMYFLHKLTNYFWFRSMAENFAIRLKELGHCPGCLSDLSADSRTKIRTTTCPTCSASWKVHLT